jgi:hypothetical protein
MPKKHNSSITFKPRLSFAPIECGGIFIANKNEPRAARRLKSRASRKQIVAD